MCTQPGNWQDAIDKIWHSAAQKGDLVSFANAHNDTARVRFARQRKYLGCIHWLEPYLSSCDKVQHKSAEKARHLRNEGNKHFQKKAFQKALDLYTQSILCSPQPPSTELSLGYGNRSAVLYHLSKYKACICDIEMALQWRFPEPNQYKLYQRWGQCLVKLGNHKHAAEKFQKALDNLGSQAGIDVKRKGEIEDWLHQSTRTEGLDTATSNPEHHPELSPPALSYGKSPHLPQASVAVNLQYNATKGRHLVAEQVISAGDTLIVERPFAAVLLPDHYDSHCHHCFDKLHLAYPCGQCNTVRFCSSQCQMSAWNRYHQYECAYLHILHSIGIAHLGLRVVLMAGLEAIRDTAAKLEALQSSPSNLIEGVNERDQYDTDYWSVYHLMPHTDDMVTDDLFQYTLTAALLGKILLRCNFVKVSQRDCETSKTSQLDKQMEEVKLSGSASNCVTQEEYDYICGLLLRHIQQLVCNAHAITELQASDVDHCDNVEDNSQVRVATAIYPTASLMNHSCDPTIISSFHKDTLVVRTVKDVPLGGEIFNCYGPHCKRMCHAERQESLKGQYFFTCKCEACEQGEYEDKIFQAFRCVKCSGPVCAEGRRLSCRSCSHTHELTDEADKFSNTQSLFVGGLELLEGGDIQGALCKLEKCYEIQREMLYKHNRDLAQTQDCIARCWAMLGNLNKSATFLEESLETTKLVYGEKSVEFGNELSKLAGILFNNQDVAKALPIINQSLDILTVHYGENHPSLSELLEMKECLVQLKT